MATELQSEAEIASYIDSKIAGPETPTLPEGMYWVVYVSDALELPNGEVSRVSRRFEFKGETASLRAWRCYQESKRNGFTARAEKVRKV